MKLMVCANLGVGELPAIDLESSKIAAWQADKVKALTHSFDDAQKRGAKACVIAGGLFAQDFVAQSLLESTTKAMNDHGLPMYYAPVPGELVDKRHRFQVTDVMKIIEPGEGTRTSIDLDEGSLSIPVVDGTDLEQVEAVVRPDATVAIVRVGNDIGVSLNGGSSFVRMGPLAPSAFGDRLRSGYLLVDIDGRGGSAEWIEGAVHPFVMREVTIDRPQSTRELVTTVGEAVKDVDRNACLRIELEGRLPLDVYINTESLAERLGRYFFYVEVVDECELDINAAELDTDVSLLAEFVRSVMGDDSLSGAEKVRILRCGWNVLNGKELAE